jgi:hypothetical protein
MKTSSWHKVYSYLLNKYFIKNKMIVRLIYTDKYIAVFLVLRSSKIITTRLDDFVKDFSIINY